MALPVASILAAMPWGMLIERAPAILSGASNLLASVGVKRKAIPAPSQPVLDAGGAVDPARLAATVRGLEESVLGLNKQMGEASALIRDLAEANRALVLAGRTQRRWLWGLTVLALLSLGLAIWR